MSFVFDKIRLNVVQEDDKKSKDVNTSPNCKIGACIGENYLQN